SKFTFIVLLSPNGCTCMRLRMLSILVTLPPTNVVFPFGTGGTSSSGSPGLYRGSSSGFTPAAAPFGAGVFWVAGVLFLLAPVSDCVGGAPVWADAIEIATRRRLRGT